MKKIENIIEKYNLIIDTMPEKNRFYHLKSISNFIEHFDEISDEKSKNNVLELLYNYINHIAYNNVNSNKECQRLFYEYINPIGMVYKKYCDFSYFIRPQSIFFYQIIFNLLIFLIKLELTVIVIINLAITGLIFFMYKKGKSTKVYSVNW